MEQPNVTQLDLGLDKEAREQSKLDFKRETTKLKSLIKQADTSGKSAWLAGKKLKTIKNLRTFKLKYQSFDEYVKAEFNIGEQTANTYIKVHEYFQLKQVGNLIISNLKIITDIVSAKTRNQIIKTLSTLDPKTYNIQFVISIVSIIRAAKSDINPKEIEKIIQSEFKNFHIEQNLKKTKLKKIQKFGDNLKSEAFPEIASVFEKEPINEMGLVALFCTIFSHFQKSQISLEFGQLTVKAIKFIQAPFPDACIICKVNDPKHTNTELYIEFEFYSYDFINHEHFKSKNKCDLIICWEDNARKNKMRANLDLVKLLPPIISVKDFLATGKLELIT